MSALLIFVAVACSESPSRVVGGDRSLGLAAEETEVGIPLVSPAARRRAVRSLAAERLPDEGAGEPGRLAQGTEQGGVGGSLVGLRRRAALAVGSRPGGAAGREADLGEQH